MRLLLNHPGYVVTVKEKLGESFFSYPVHQRIFDLLLELSAQPGDLAHRLLESITEPADQQAFLRLLLLEVPGDPEALLHDFIKTIRRSLEREVRLNLLKRLRAAEEQGDPQAVRSALTDLKELLSLNTKGV